MFRTCARAGTAASVSQPVSHNDEEHSFDVFIHTAFVYMLTVSGPAHHVKRQCCDRLHHTQPGLMEQTAKQNGKKKNEVILLSVSYEDKQHNGVLPASPQIAHLLRQCGSWISGGLVVKAERGNRVQPA